MSGIYKAMCDILAEFPVVTKDRRNPSQGYAYRGIDDVYMAAHGLLAKHRVFPSPVRLTVTHMPAASTARGAEQVRCVVQGDLRFTHEDTSFVEVGLIGEGIDTGDKAVMKAISNAIKYSYWNTFCVPSDEKKDSDAYEDMPAAKPQIDTVTMAKKIFSKETK